ncbi:ctr copper transporter [Phlyctema vagabunda]|uniref:Copper transport protein n=1 Tax=Phlyctema vagabunda TaxID=108571 RepID=A0ABR4P533_9HELO
MDHSSSSASASACKISMLWNWNTIDACFISTSWRITSTSMFAGSCIGVIFLVMTLELLRRLAKEYDGLILRQYQRHVAAPLSLDCNPVAACSTERELDFKPAQQNARLSAATSFRPNLVQQLTRATLHMLQFGVAYFIMLLAMYYNGYFIICIMIGAWLGAFCFSWESVTLSGPKEDATVCCG